MRVGWGKKGEFSKNKQQEKEYVAAARKKKKKVIHRNPVL